MTEGLCLSSQYYSINDKCMQRNPYRYHDTSGNPIARPFVIIPLSGEGLAFFPKGMSLRTAATHRGMSTSSCREPPV